MSPAPSHPIIDPGTFRLNTFLWEFKVANLTSESQSEPSESMRDPGGVIDSILFYLIIFLYFYFIVD